MENVTKEDCLDTLKRFTGRRVTPQEMKIRDEEFKDLINNFPSQNHIDWLLIPSRTPHFGGLWEAADYGKSATSAFTTLLTQIEAILNSRHLTASSTDINETLALTPGHCIIERPITAIHEPSSSKNNTLS